MFLWAVAPCSPADALNFKTDLTCYFLRRRRIFVHFKTEARVTSKALIHMYQTTLPHILEDGNYKSVNKHCIVHMLYEVLISALSNKIISDS